MTLQEGEGQLPMHACSKGVFEMGIIQQVFNTHI
jgi:hypothetical protein